jgi:N-acetylglucosaminyldiphosphoundecaprenol N-acetyl-beta-D-mannosaminyltransferase
MRVELFNTPVDILTMDQTIAMAVKAMETKTRCQHVALNVAKLVNAQSDAELDRDVRDSDIVGIDGMGIVYALKLLGHKVPERVAGVDLFEALMGVCAAGGFRPYLLGATQDVLDRTVAELQRRHPTLQFAGTRNGYFKPEEDAAVAAEIRASGADCLFIAMPTPRKERFMRAYRDAMAVPFLMGVGGTFDVIAGHVQRAPAAWQRSGMEWAYRLVQEPRRMFWRYARTNALFARMLLPALLRRLFGHRAQAF